MARPRNDASGGYIFDFETMESFEVGAWLMAILAFPLPHEIDSREAAANALGARQIRVQFDADPRTAAGWRARFPDYAAIAIREEKRGLRTLQNRIWRRMIAARMALAFIAPALYREQAQLPPEVPRPSINELSKLVLPQSGESDPENVEHRTWRSSRPVIHLAAALQVGIRAVACGDPSLSKGVPYDLANGPLHRRVIDLASIYEPIVLSDKRFGRRRGDLIRLRVA